MLCSNSSSIWPTEYCTLATIGSEREPIMNALLQPNVKQPIIRTWSKRLVKTDMGRLDVRWNVKTICAPHRRRNIYFVWHQMALNGFPFISSKLKSLRAAKQWEKQGIERIGRKGEMANKDMTGRRQDTSEVRYSSRTLDLHNGNKRFEQRLIAICWNGE